MTAQPVNIAPTGQPIAVWMGNPNAPSILVVNPDTANTVYVNWSATGPNLAIGGNNSIPLGPGQAVVIPGTQTIYVIGSKGTAATIVIPGGTSFFQPTTLSAIGGVTIFVQASTPTQPPTIPLNSVWIDTANGSINNWNGTTWVEQQFNATNLIQAGTIVASLIEANTITAAQLAAGIIYAGIINGTTVSAATFNGSTFNGTNFTINSTGAYFYSGAPAAGNLIFTISPTTTTDAFANQVLAGIVTYNGSNAIVFNPGTLAMTAYTNASGQSGAWTVNTIFMMTTGAVLNPGILYLAGVNTSSIAPLSAGIGVLYANINGTPSASSRGTFLGSLPISQVNGGVGATGNVTAFTLITNQYTVDSTLIANSKYKLRVYFNGTWGLQVMTIGADINGTVTTLATVGAAFATGAASGDAINGYLEIEVYIVSTTTCRISCTGMLHDNTVNTNNSDTAGCIISGTVATGITIAGANTLGISIKFAASVVGQTITPEFEEMVRSGS